MKKALTKTELELKRRVKKSWAMLPRTDAKDCILIWRKVLSQMISDALSKERSAKKKAVIWFLKDEKDFNLTCSLAQVDPYKLRQHIINRLTEEDPNIIEKLLLEKSEKTNTKKNSLTYGTVKPIENPTQISFFFNSQEVRAYVENDELWFDLTHLNRFIKFVDYSIVRLVDLDTYVNTSNLRKSKNKAHVIFANLKGIYQLSASFENQNLSSFADWIEQGMYKYDILKGLNFFFLKFEDVKILAWLHKKRLFLHFADIDIFFPVLTQITRKEAQQKDKHFYVYLNSKKRQFMVRADLLIQIIESRNVIKKEHQTVKPKLIQWRRLTLSSGLLNCSGLR